MKAPSDAPRKLSSPDLDAYYKLSAPTEDLLGDVDSFGVKRQWGGQPLSQVMREYYVSPSSGVKKRWQTFCSANSLVYTKAGKAIQWNPTLRLN